MPKKIKKIKKTKKNKKNKIKNITKEYQIKKLFEDNNIFTPSSYADKDKTNICNLIIKFAKYNNTDILFSFFYNNKTDYKRLDISSIFYTNSEFKSKIFKYTYYYKNIHILINCLNINSLLNSKPEFNNLIFLHFLKYIKNKKSSFYKLFKNNYFDFSSCKIETILKWNGIRYVYIDFKDLIYFFNLYYKYKPINTNLNFHNNSILKFNSHNKYIFLLYIFLYFKNTKKNIFKKFGTLLKNKINEQGNYAIMSFPYIISYCIYFDRPMLLDKFIDYILKLKYNLKFSLLMSLNSMIDCIDRNAIRVYYKFENELYYYISHNFKHDIKKLYSDKYFEIINKLSNNPIIYNNISSDEYPTINKFITAISKCTKISPIDNIIINNIYNSNVINTEEYANCKNIFVSI